MLAKSGRRSPSKSEIANVKPGPSEEAGEYPACARAAVPPNTRPQNSDRIMNRNGRRGLFAGRFLTMEGTPNSRAKLDTTLIIAVLGSLLELTAVVPIAWLNQTFAAQASLAALVVCLALTVAQVFVVVSVAASAAAQAWAVVWCQDSAAALVVGSALAPGLVLCPDLALCLDLASCPDLALCPDLASPLDLVSCRDSGSSRDLALCPDSGSSRDLALCPDSASPLDLVSCLDLALCLDSALCLDLALCLDSASAAASAGSDWVSAAVEDWSAPKACCSVAGYKDDSAGDNSAGDSPNCRRIRDGCYSTQDADDTKGAEGDMDFPTSPTRCDCNKRGLIPNSIPSLPNPMAGC